MLIWLPDDDWSDHLTLPAEVAVEVWRSDRAVPDSVTGVEFYVPEYLGPPSVVDIVQSMPSLKVVQTLTAGYEHLLDRLPRGVVLCNARGVHEASTAELAVGLTIASLRGFPGFVRAQDKARWAHERYQALADKRVLILGYGSVGRAVAERLRPFEVELVLVANHPRPGIHVLAQLPELLPTVDVVVLTVPLTAATTHLVNHEFLSQMHDGSLLVNVSRGSVVDTDALLLELNAKRLHAALDVTEPEPLPASHPLWKAPNLLVSPHVGGDTSAFPPRAWRLLQEQLNRYIAGGQLLNVVSIAGSVARG